MRSQASKLHPGASKALLTNPTKRGFNWQKQTRVQALGFNYCKTVLTVKGFNKRKKKKKKQDEKDREYQHKSGKINLQTLQRLVFLHLRVDEFKGKTPKKTGEGLVL